MDVVVVQAGQQRAAGGVEVVLVANGAEPRCAFGNIAAGDPHVGDWDMRQPVRGQRGARLTASGELAD